MPGNNKKRIKHICCQVITLALVFIFLPHTLCASDSENRRIWAGLDLFPSILAADKDIHSKTGTDGKLLLILTYIDDKEAAGELASHLKKIDTIRALPIRIELTADTTFQDYDNTQAAGIFIAQKLPPDRLSEVIQFGKEHKIIIFSPFRADVENGVLGGIIINDRVLPYVNAAAIRQSSIRLKSFFLRIAKTYE